MKRVAWIAGILIAGSVQASYAFFGRDSISSVWPDKPVEIDGRAVEWSELPVVEVSGMSFHAMNDVSNLYLLIRGTTNDGRELLSGRYRQNVTLWFLKPDHKTKTWGINLDFGHAKLPAEGVSPTLASMGMTPEMVVPQGLEVSTATFPSEFDFQADLSSQRGRQPIYEIRIPLQMIEQNGKSIYIDMVSSEISPDVKAELQTNRTEQHPAGSQSPAGGGGQGGGMGGGRHHRGGGSSGGAASSTFELPKPIQVHLTIGLTKEPKH